MRLRTLTAATLMYALPCVATPPVALDPTAVLCAERVLRLADLATLENSEKFEALRNAVNRLSGIERLPAPQLSDFKDSMASFSDPIVAVQAYYIVRNLVKNSHEPDLSLWQGLETHLIRAIQSTLVSRFRRYRPASRPESALMTPADIRAEGTRIVEQLDLEPPGLPEAVLRLGDVRGVENLSIAFSWLRFILSLAQTNRLDEIAQRSQEALIFIVLKTYELAHLGIEGADNLLAQMSGGDARQFVRDVEALREGRSPIAGWHSIDGRNVFGNKTSPQELAEAAATQLDLGVLAGQYFPREVNYNILKNILDHKSPQLPDGEPIQRRFSKLQEQTLLLVAGLYVDPRARSGRAGDALDRAMWLIGDPRVEQASLYDWLHSLYGERRLYDQEQFTRYLEEANAIYDEVSRLGLSRRVIIAREHRKTTDEVLVPSFDLQVVRRNDGKVEQLIEIKQTSRPSLPSDLSGIFKQAARKLEKIENVKARRILLVQIPWTDETLVQVRQGLKFLSKPDGTIERYRIADNDGGDGDLFIGKQNIFEEVRAHLGELAGIADYDEIRITSTDGKILTIYVHDRGTLTWNTARKI